MSEVIRGILRSPREKLKEVPTYHNYHMVYYLPPVEEGNYQVTYSEEESFTKKYTSTLDRRTLQLTLAGKVGVLVHHSDEDSECHWDIHHLSVTDRGEGTWGGSSRGVQGSTRGSQLQSGESRG